MVYIPAYTPLYFPPFHILNKGVKMEFLSIFVVPFAVGILTPAIFTVIKSNNLKKEIQMNINSFVVGYSTGLSVSLLLFAILLSVVLLVLNIYEHSNLSTNLIVPIFILLFAFGAYSLSREKIIIDRDTIVFTPTFGKNKIYHFKDITKIETDILSNGTVVYSVYTNKKIFSMDSMKIGVNLFLQKAQKFNIVIININDK